MGKGWGRGAGWSLPILVLGRASLSPLRQALLHASPRYLPALKFSDDRVASQNTEKAVKIIKDFENRTERKGLKALGFFSLEKGWLNDTLRNPGRVIWM